MKAPRQPTRREWAAITSRRPVVRRIPEPEEEAARLDRVATQQLDAHLEDEDTFRQAKPPEREREELYMESVRCYNARRQREIAAEWYAYHADQAEELKCLPKRCRMMHGEDN